MTDSERRNLWAERRRQALLEDREERLAYELELRPVIDERAFLALVWAAQLEQVRMRCG